MVLGKAGGLSGYDAIVTGLWWVASCGSAGNCGITRKAQAITGSIERTMQAAQASPEIMKNSLHPNMKPMIGPQWPMKTLPGGRDPCKGRSDRQKSR